MNRISHLVCGLALIGALLASALRPAPAAAASLPSVYVLLDGNRVAVLPASDGVPALAPVAVEGVAAGERLVAIDVRPQNNRLYALALTGGALRLYHLDLTSGAAVATPIGGAPTQFTNGANPVPTPGESFGIDFNPTVDRLRIVSDGGLNGRMNPNNGALIDGDNGGAAGSSPGLNPDGAITGATTTVDDTAYTNSAANATATTQYTLDRATDRLYIQNPPNSGTQTMGLALTLGGAPLDVTRVGGLDIPSSVAVGAANTPAAGLAYAALTVGGIDGLYQINLANGAASLLGVLGASDVLDIALAMTPAAAVALSGDGAELQRFLVARPETVVAVPITGLTAGETLAGIDGRPATGQLYGVGVNPDQDTATVYLIDPQTGAAVAVGAPGLVAFDTAAGTRIDLPPASAGYGVDFNPTVDRIRLVNAAGLNARLNPVTGAAVDGDSGGAPGSLPGVNPDGSIGGATGRVDATAYTNSFQGVAGMVRTTQYTLDSASDRIFIQNPPNAGAQTAPLPLTLDGAPLDAAAAGGFDIPPDVMVAAANAPAAGTGYAALTVSGATSLYAIDLATGAARRVGPIGGGAGGAGGLVVWSAPARGAVSLPLVTR